MTVQVYGRPGCGQCEQAKLKLHRSGIAYEYLMLDDHQEKLAEQFEVLPRSLPYIVHSDTLYNFTQVESLIKSIKG